MRKKTKQDAWLFVLLQISEYDYIGLWTITGNHRKTQRCNSRFKKTLVMNKHDEVLLSVVCHKQLEQNSH